MNVSDSFLRCDIEGSLAQLFKAAGRYEIVNVTTREPSLEEAFLAYYGVGERSSHEPPTSFARTANCSICEKRFAWQCAAEDPARPAQIDGVVESGGRHTGRGDGRLLPTIEGIEGFQELVDQYPDSLMAMFGASDLANIATPAGYLNAELFGFMVPMLMAVFAVGRGGGAVAGEERAGTMELLLSQPVSRSKLVLEKFGAMTVSILELSTFIWLVLVVGANSWAWTSALYGSRRCVSAWRCWGWPLAEWRSPLVQ